MEDLLFRMGNQARATQKAEDRKETARGGNGVDKLQHMGRRAMNGEASRPHCLQAARREKQKRERGERGEREQGK